MKRIKNSKNRSVFWNIGEKYVQNPLMARECLVVGNDKGRRSWKRKKRGPGTEYTPESNRTCQGKCMRKLRRRIKLKKIVFTGTGNDRRGGRGRKKDTTEWKRHRRNTRKIKGNYYTSGLGNEKSGKK